MKYDVFAIVERNSFYDQTEVKFFAAEDSSEAKELYIERFGDKFTSRQPYLGFSIHSVPNCYAELKGYLYQSIEI
jgi:hypothetical protein